MLLLQVISSARSRTPKFYNEARSCDSRLVLSASGAPGERYCSGGFGEERSTRRPSAGICEELHAERGRNVRGVPRKALLRQNR